MEYRRLGRSGLKVSAFALGTMMITDGRTDPTVVRRAFEKGINLIDTADAYGDKGAVEVEVGRQIKGLPRDEVVLATKARWGYGSAGPNRRGLSAKHLHHAIEASLRRLGVDFIDLYQLHNPDPETPIEETIFALGNLLRAGKIVYWGLSNFDVGQVMEVYKACDALGVPYPVSHQPGYSILNPGLVETASKRAAGLHALPPQYALGLIVYSPLASGLLTGKYRKGVPADSRVGHDPGWKDRVLTPARVAAVEKLAPIAENVGCGLTQMSLAWVLGRPMVSSIIIGPTNAAQLEENLKAADVVLSPAVLQQIEDVRTQYKEAIHNQF